MNICDQKVKLIQYFRLIVVAHQWKRYNFSGSGVTDLYGVNVRDGVKKEEHLIL